ncbi:unnamed protein product [Rhizopus stolonifer]
MPIHTASDLQVIAFLKEGYVTTVDTPDKSVYCHKRVTTNDIYELVITKTDYMLKKSEAAFATWCSKKGIHLMNSPAIKKGEKGSNSRYRELYVLKDEYMENIAKYVPKYQTHINPLKSQSYIIIGYARKSPGYESKQKKKKKKEYGALFNGNI